MGIDKLTMDIKVDPGAIISGSSTVEVEDLTLVPTLVILSYRCKVERGKAVLGGIWRDS